jgi:hypothetical protein
VRIRRQNDVATEVRRRARLVDERLDRGQDLVRVGIASVTRLT